SHLRKYFSEKTSKIGYLAFWKSYSTKILSFELGDFGIQHGSPYDIFPGFPFVHPPHFRNSAPASCGREQEEEDDRCICQPDFIMMSMKHTEDNSFEVIHEKSSEFESNFCHKDYILKCSVHRVSSVGRICQPICTAGSLFGIAAEGGNAI
ncbi:hypothetical protein Taro_044306, partial [Colocasia esculenta]|nr:hypothetical protein [Colocasia esculenta]